MDNLNWETKIYETEDGASPIEEFLDALPAKDTEKILRDIQLLQRFGPRWGHPHIDYFKHEKIYELRVKHSSNIYRIFFFTWKETILLLTHGFTKKSQKTPKAEIQRAVRSRKDWINRKGE
ncbi:type II toxin-antitoxin system RelE/ParE family toxin [Planococcus sp. ANT_H30]|uniref:type II toxin-antitoxin system RelE/ParE family toxin n=1 Tax=Planococcus sp. ANT_H30 TaxID=2597347 RepID=UPI0011EF5F6C|nr:type II toxin-antitoxin system RelE/ParE family toxin [Planococcus sp. ANT_H30]KAA0957468.1 type II toxin-antitoxin system RelE/ParE family toxin [Planococcus sp. ANT_H30]